MSNVSLINGFANPYPILALMINSEFFPAIKEDFLECNHFQILDVCGGQIDLFPVCDQGTYVKLKFDIFKSKIQIEGNSTFFIEGASK